LARAVRPRPTAEGADADPAPLDGLYGSRLKDRPEAAILPKCRT